MNTKEVLERGIVNIIPDKKDLIKLLNSGKKLNIYMGIDPTATKIHLGHAVLLKKLQNFVEERHRVTFLIGDFTTLIGDTSDKESERPILSEQEIKKNFQTYKKQASKFLDFSKIKTKFNSVWLKKLGFREIIRLSQYFSLGDFIGRELIRERLKAGKRVRFDELYYPIMQGYDSYYLDTDIQIGGADQTFNMQSGRTLQKKLRGKESFVLVSQYLTGTDGRKMSKSWGNAIWLDDEPNEIYGKIMSLKDSLIEEYFILTTSLSFEEVKEITKRAKTDPLAAKKRLAFEIVSELHNKEEAAKAQTNFERVFQKKELPVKMKVVNTNEKKMALLDLVFTTRLIQSRSQIKRLIIQGAVEIDSKTARNPQGEISLTSKGVIVKIGKRKFAKVKHG